MTSRALFVVAFVAALTGCRHGSSTGDEPDLAGPTSCDPNPCTSPNRTTCLLDPPGVRCACDPGTHEDPSGCVPDTTCLPTSCNGHGTCDASSGAIACACDPDYTGAACKDCRAGLFPDGTGGCSADPCKTLACASMSECNVQGGVPSCVCKAGAHDDHGNCVPDQTCMPSTCAGHGTCHDETGLLSCDCSSGYTGPFCDACAVGFHADGNGGCTDDACKPSPCTTPHKTVCTASASSATCSCDPGYHAVGGGCVVDETCTPTSCGGHGTCSIVGGVRSCACAGLYTGATCADCSSGAHPDGAGGCTTDVCVPSPCTLAHKTVCTALGATAQCGCDAGYHADGVGGCTNDPCTPNLCAATNQACRVVNGAAECYTPSCSDNNPCTADALVGGSCQHTPLANGTACATNLCMQGQTCTAGTCAGGTTRTCDDGNPCTKDVCDPVSGCKATNDDTLVPSDGVACTVDKCTNGAASHTANHAACDDGKWCTGAETCAPGAGADANGCVHTSVPVAPLLAANECSSYGCDEGTHAFVLTKQPVGTPCDDHDACSTGDACRADGACRGLAVTSCPAPGCTTVSALGSVIDLRFGNVSGTVKLNGAAVPTFDPADGGTIVLSLVAKDTGTSHTIDRLEWTYSSPGYSLVRGATYATRILPGVYDLLYERNYYQNGNYSSLTSGNASFPNGRRWLQRDVVIGTGNNALDIDIPATSLTGTVRLNGAALPTSDPADGGTISLSLVAKDTGAEHTIDLVEWTYSSPGYSLVRGGTYTTKIPPGTYDLLYERNYYQSGNFSTMTYASDPFANGRRYLRRDVVIGSGSAVLDIDLPSASLTGTVKLNGAAFPTSDPADGATIALSLVAKDTGASHVIDRIEWSYTSPGYTLVRGNTYATKVPPGTYDLLYERNYYQSGNFSTLTSSNDPLANGRRYLQRDVVVAAGSNTLDIDLGVASLMGTVKLNGAAFPTSDPADGATIALSLVSKDTGASHVIDRIEWSYTSPGYTLVRGNTYATKIPPGTYDLLYERNYYQSGNFSTLTSSNDPLANGRRYLQRDVVVAAGSNTLDIDLGVASLMGTVRLNGAAFPTSDPADGATIALSLVSKDTGASHVIDRIEWSYTSPGYTLVRGNTYATKVPPGTYDLLYERNYYQSGNFSTLTSSNDPLANGRRYLQRDVVIAAGSNTLDIDVPATGLSGSVTVAGAAFPTFDPADGGTLALSLVAKDTGASHVFDRVEWTYSSPGYSLQRGATYATRVLPGTYDVLYERNDYPTGNFSTLTAANDPIVNGRRLIGMCVTVP